jgi:glucose-6-phosphate 1-epimerase
MSDSAALPSTVAGNGGMPKVVISHSSGATAELYLFGATLTSFKNAKGQEMLFTSSKAVFDHKKAIRGGVPLVFPQFGANGPLPQHGFARNSEWKLTRVADGLCELELSDSEATRAIWPHHFHLMYRVQIDDKSLATSLHITNPKERYAHHEGETTAASSAAFSFDALLHTYLAIGHENIEGIAVHGLKGHGYISKPEGGARKTQEEEPLVIKDGLEVDRVYYNIKPDAAATLGEGIPPHAIILKGIKTSTAEGAYNAVAVTSQSSLRDAFPSVRGGVMHGFPLDTVVWNPGPARAATIADLGGDDWKSYVCIEPGLVSPDSHEHGGNKELAPGKCWTLQQQISFLHL